MTCCYYVVARTVVTVVTVSVAAVQQRRPGHVESFTGLAKECGFAYLDNREPSRFANQEQHDEINQEALPG